MNTLPRIGLMLGDMTGIGPEISAKILAARTFKPLARIAVIGDARVLELGAKDARVDLSGKVIRMSTRSTGRATKFHWSISVTSTPPPSSARKCRRSRAS